MTTIRGEDRYVVCSQPSAWRQEYEFREAGELVGRLVMDGGFRSSAHAKYAGKDWLFERKGFWKPVTTCSDTSGQALAEYRPDFWGSSGEIVTGFGTVLRLSNNFWATRYKLEDESGVDLLTVEGIRGFLHFSCNLRVGAVIGVRPEADWLSPFLMFIILMHMRDSAAAAAAA